MAYQVTIYTAAEREKIRQGQEWNTDPSTWARYRAAERKVGPFGGAYEQAAELWIGIQRGEGNLTTQKEWLDALAAAIKNCSRSDGNGRGMTKAEFMETLVYQPVQAEAEKMAKHFNLPMADALKQVRKGWNCDWQVTERTPRVPMRGGCRRNMKAAEVKGVLSRLGWD